MLSPSVGSSESEGSPGLHAAGGRDQSPSTIGGVAGAPAWRQTYVVGAGGGGGGGGMSPPVPPPMNPGQSTNGDAGNVDAFRGKRGRDVEADIARDIARSVTTTVSHLLPPSRCCPDDLLSVWFARVMRSLAIGCSFLLPSARGLSGLLHVCMYVCVFKKFCFSRARVRETRSHSCAGTGRTVSSSAAAAVPCLRSSVGAGIAGQDGRPAAGPSAGETGLPAFPEETCLPDEETCLPHSHCPCSSARQLLRRK